jgi:hypothetical protein
MECDERSYSADTVLCAAEKKLPASIHIVLEGEVSFCTPNPRTNNKMTILKIGEMGIFGDFSHVIRDAEFAVEAMTNVDLLEDDVNGSGAVGGAEGGGGDAGDSTDFNTTTNSSSGAKTSSGGGGITRQVSLKKQGERSVTSPKINSKNVFNTKISVKSFGQVTAVAGFSEGDAPSSPPPLSTQSPSSYRGLGAKIAGVGQKLFGIHHKRVSESIIANNSMVIARDLGYETTTVQRPAGAGIILADPNSEATGRLVLSKFQIETYTACRVLHISKKSFASLMRFITAESRQSAFETILERVTQQSKWCDTQFHLVTQEENTLTSVATGEQLFVQQSMIINCDHCNHLRCYSTKQNCKRSRLHALHVDDTQALRSIRNGLTSSADGSGNRRLLVLKASAGEDFAQILKNTSGGTVPPNQSSRQSTTSVSNTAGSPNSTQNLRNIKENASSEREAEKVEKQQSKGGRRNSIDLLLDLFRAKKSGEGQEDAAKGLDESENIDDIVALKTVKRSSSKINERSTTERSTNKTRERSVGTLAAKLEKALFG